MYKILRRERLNENVVLMDVLAPMVARKCKAGQFIMLRVDENGERAPDQLYVLSDNLQTLGVRKNKTSFVRELLYRENDERERFTVFIVSADNKPNFVVEELDKYALHSNIGVEYRSYRYGDGLVELKADLAQTEGRKKVLLLSSATNGNTQDAEVFLSALDLKLNAELDASTEVYAEIVNPANVKALQNLGVA